MSLTSTRIIYLTGAYVDTQLMGFQLYGAYYYSHFNIPAHTSNPAEPELPKLLSEDGYPGSFMVCRV